MTHVRTVLGDIAPEELGITLTHEHIRYAYQGSDTDHHHVWSLDHLAGQIAPVLKDGRETHGIQTVVDMTPPEIGRHPELLAEVSRRSGVHVVAMTGFFPEEHAIGIPFHWRRKPPEYLTEMLVRDITEGMVYDNQLTPYRAGILKAATGGITSTEANPSSGPNGISPLEAKVICAVARAQRQTGACINTHTQPEDYAYINPGIDLLNLLERYGADPSRVIIGHAFVHPNINQLREIVERGACLQIDHIGIPWQNDSQEGLDELIATAVCQLTDLGYLDRLVFSYDRFFSYAGSPPSAEEPPLLNEQVPIGYMFENFAHRLEKKGFGKAEMHTVMVENPRRLLAF
jgi:phosphotriesterase-related protein